MEWVKSEYERRVCREQGEQRVFDTADIDRTENKNFIRPTPPADKEINLFLLFIFAIGIIMGIVIGIQL